MTRKPVFDLVREMLGRRFSQGEVERLDAALDDLSAAVLRNPAPTAPSCTVSPVGLQLIRRFEGCARLRPDGRFEAYPDPGTGGAPWTIGWGATGSAIREGTVWTREECDARLLADIERHAEDVRQALAGAPVTQGQFDALVSFHFNTGAIHRATLTRLHRSGEYEKAAREFARWKFAGGRVLRGLVRRRREEAALYVI